MYMNRTPTQPRQLMGSLRALGFTPDDIAKLEMFGFEEALDKAGRVVDRLKVELDRYERRTYNAENQHRTLEAELNNVRWRMAWWVAGCFLFGITALGLAIVVATKL